jgi:hypothetical protein
MVCWGWIESACGVGTANGTGGMKPAGIPEKMHRNINIQGFIRYF